MQAESILCSALSTGYFKVCLSGQIFYLGPRNFATTSLPKPRYFPVIHRVSLFHCWKFKTKKLFIFFAFVKELQKGMHFWLYEVFSSSFCLPSPKSSLDYNEILPKTWKQQGTSLNLLNNVWRKMFAKEKQIILYSANSGRLVSTLGHWQLMRSPESAQRTVLGTGYF